MHVEATKLLARLDATAIMPVPLDGQYDLIGDIPESEFDLSFVRTILGFIENNPDLDFGTPGPLVRAMERMYGHGYEKEVFLSVSRKPTDHTVWLLNRIINGEKDPIKLEAYILLMRKISSDQNLPNPPREAARFFLSEIEKRSK